MRSDRPVWLTSPQNPLLKRFRRALRGDPTEWEAEGIFAVEGMHLVEEALSSPVEVVALLAARSAEPSLAQVQTQPNSPSSSPDPPRRASGGRRPLRSYIVPDRVFRSLAQTQAPQGIAALLRLPPRRLAESLGRPGAVVAALVGLQDPGNLGTILRSLEAFGGAACLLTQNTVSAFNPKAVRASAGSIFRVPVFLQLTVEKTTALCREHGLKTIGLAPRATRSLPELDLEQPLALFVGGEGSGLEEEVLQQLDETARIPLAQRVESLNVATALSLALYEIARHRALLR